MSVNRRDFLALTSVAALGAVAARQTFAQHGASELSSDKTARPKYAVYGLGMHGGLFPGGRVYARESQSVLTELRLDSGDVKQTLLAMPKGHYVNVHVPNYLVCTPIQGPILQVLDLDHKIVKTLSTEQDYSYGGHSLFIPGEELIVASVKSNSANGAGYLLVYDSKTFSLVDKVPIDGKYPHDIKLRPGTSHEVVVGHGAHPRLAHDADQAGEAVVSVIDLKSKTVVARFDRTPLLGINHLALDSAEQIYSSQLSSLPISEASYRQLAEKFDVRDWRWGDLSGGEKEEIPYPAPVLQFQPNGDLKTVFSAPGKHLRHQDIAWCESLKLILSTYSESNSIVKVTSDGTATSLDAERFNIQKVRGVNPIPGSDLVLLNDNEAGIALVDFKSERLLKFYPIRMYMTRHLSSRPLA